MNNQRVWVFDLDDTLHDASSHIFPVMNRAMTQYIMDELKLDEPAAFQLRQHYWRIYGATLKGLMRHHNVDPHHFLHQTHAFMDLPNMVVQTKGLKHIIQQLSGRKVVFTNAPIAYALRVLKLMGIEDIFEHVFSVESSQFHPKPSPRGFAKMLKTIRAQAHHCVMIEDTLSALMTAKRLGMKTVYVSKTLTKPSFVDVRISNITQILRSNIDHS
ncbi:MAG TPA: pyrimidine 5'-nucleotidase [Methylophilaceae bacterium]